MKKITFIFNLSVLVLLAVYGCSSSDSEDINNNNTNNTNNTVIPTNLVVSLDIQGQDANNPNGDGSGVLNLSATATNAVRYGFKVGTADEVDSPSGNFTYNVNTQGLNQFPVTIYAYSTSENSISKIQNITIFVDEDNNGGTGNNDTLVWSDEFDGNGTINTNKWTYEIGGGGWGNQEVQSYTNSLNNVYKENGILKIKVIKESNNTYTSGRIITKNKFDFKYGRVDIRAKLPSAAGTWPALWMLGQNINSVSWPECGEIDIMEQFVNKNSVSSTLHWFNPDNVNSDNPLGQASYGGDIADSTFDEFHVYSLNWTSSTLSFSLDGAEFFTTGNSGSLPFNQNFFLIFNIAMGGTNGGTIDPNFTTDAMEVDYIRVYQ
jgi:hypothetical protein